jgi:pyruvate/2-oxoglutarate dehydrogenase complex dihydrolipoamide acyltransferase (E2) component
MQRARLLIIGAGAVIVVALFLVLRPGGDEDEAAVPATTTTAETATTETEASPSPATPPPTAPPPKPKPKPQPAVIRIRIQGGKPVGGITRATVKKGRQVRLVVRSDVADHVHVHGYDLMRDLVPGQPTQLAFRATVPGGFEIELEDRGLQIAELRVQP